MPGQEDPQTREPGIFDSFKAVAATMFTLLQTRVDLLATELEEELQRLVRLALLAAVAGFFGGLFVLMLALTVVIGLFLLVVLAALSALKRIANSRPRLLAATRDELRRDREAFESRLRADTDEPAT
jgi:uncharacterized membrane protein YqjE